MLRKLALRGKVAVAEPVRAALARRGPVVALETAIVTHGMPHPVNLETALSLERIVAEEGAVPATVSVIGGVILVGTGAADLERLASPASRPMKLSARDLAYAVAAGRDGGTTAAAAAAVAGAFGISLLATGGTGGVHRDGHVTMDVSADLVQLGRTPVCVVCSGVKSVLDVGRTLEYLETQGVCVATYGADDDDFPAFYARRSGHRAPYAVADPRAAAELVRAALDSGLGSGVMLAVPVPRAHAMEPEEAEAAIVAALRRSRGVAGKAVTPAVLAGLSEITGGRSLRTNVALVENNARVAARIAVLLAGRPDRTGRPSDGRPLVVGGTNRDIAFRLETTRALLDGTTHPAKVTRSRGGVARNVAECLFRLGADPLLLTAADPDSALSSPFECRSPPGVEETATYAAVLGPDGECLLGLGDMGAHEAVTPEWIESNADAFERCSVVVMDGNLSLPATDRVLALAERFRRPVFFEPTDVRKATKPFDTETGRRRRAEGRPVVEFASPNRAELLAAATHLGLPSGSCDEAAEAMAGLVPDLFVKLGAEGVLVSAPESPPFADGRYVEGRATSRPPALHRVAPVPVRNASGAGDCFAAGLLRAALEGLPVDECVRRGVAAATASLQSDLPVPAVVPRD